VIFLVLAFFGAFALPSVTDIVNTSLIDECLPDSSSVRHLFLPWQVSDAFLFAFKPRHPLSFGSRGVDVLREPAVLFPVV
jgi:hypothetical protein